MKIEKKTSVLLITPSEEFLDIIKSSLRNNESFEMLGATKNIILALPKIKFYKPDLVLIDFDLFTSRDLEEVKNLIQETTGRNIFIICSEDSNPDIILKTLDTGVQGFILKPKTRSKKILEDFTSEIFNVRIKEFRLKNSYNANINRFNLEPEHSLKSNQNLFEVCAIGISTGGPDTLKKLIPKISNYLNGSILIVQHMPPSFTRQLADTLSKTTKLKVLEGSQGLPIEKNTIYIAPGGKHMTVESSGTRKIISILDTPPEESCKPSVNILFRSVARHYGPKAIGVIMTGMGQDGYYGLLELKSSGAYLIAQDEKSSVVYGMPQRPVQEKLVSEVLGIEGIADRISKLLGEPKA